MRGSAAEAQRHPADANAGTKRLHGGQGLRLGEVLGLLETDQRDAVVSTETTQGRPDLTLTESL